jgi:phosphoglycerol transferase MdoB-like AlkP superfamily enzyme
VFLQLSREPLLVFVVLFLLSLLASYVLFKLLESRANIKRKEWSAGGAIAGFLIILFGSWYAIRPTLTALPRTMPVSVPVGFKPFDVSDMGIAIAVPDNWERKPHPTEIFLAPKQQQQNSTNAMFIMITVQSCDGPQYVVSESDLQKLQQPLQQMMG